MVNPTTAPFERYAASSGSLYTNDGAQSIAFSTKTDFDLGAVEKYAAVRTRDELPRSIPVKNSDSDFVVVGIGTYSYDGKNNSKKDFLEKNFHQNYKKKQKCTKK